MPLHFINYNINPGTGTYWTFIQCNRTPHQLANSNYYYELARVISMFAGPTSGVRLAMATMMLKELVLYTTFWTVLVSSSYSKWWAISKKINLVLKKHWTLLRWTNINNTRYRRRINHQVNIYKLFGFTRWKIQYLIYL